MKTFIDGDACWATAKLVREALKKGNSVHIYCDTNHTIEYRGAKTHYVDPGKDSADLAIINAAGQGDAVYTADMGLASLCVVKGARAYDFTGRLYPETEISSALISRFARNRANKSRKGNGYKHKAQAYA